MQFCSELCEGDTWDLKRDDTSPSPKHALPTQRASATSSRLSQTLLNYYNSKAVVADATEREASGEEAEWGNLTAEEFEPTFTNRNAFDAEVAEEWQERSDGEGEATPSDNASDGPVGTSEVGEGADYTARMIYHRNSEVNVDGQLAEFSKGRRSVFFDEGFGFGGVEEMNETEPPPANELLVTSTRMEEMRAGVQPLKQRFSKTTGIARRISLEQKFLFRREAAAILLQSLYRGFCARREYRVLQAAHWATVEAAQAQKRTDEEFRQRVASATAQADDAAAVSAAEEETKEEAASEKEDPAAAAAQPSPQKQKASPRFANEAEDFIRYSVGAGGQPDDDFVESEGSEMPSPYGSPGAALNVDTHAYSDSESLSPSKPTTPEPPAVAPERAPDATPANHSRRRLNPGSRQTSKKTMHGKEHTRVSLRSQFSERALVLTQHYGPTAERAAREIQRVWRRHSAAVRYNALSRNIHTILHEMKPTLPPTAKRRKSRRGSSVTMASMPQRFTSVETCFHVPSATPTHEMRPRESRDSSTKRKVDIKTPDFVL
eukprot:Rhum_TRINITY_DN20638_c0_g1::Rhum_TRINITY_DN20638_c0_g1_i1::g.171649::m.171649